MPSIARPIVAHSLGWRAARAAATLALGVVPLAGCGDDLLEAQSQYNLDTVATVYTVFPISSAAAPLSTALSLSAFAPVRPAIALATITSGGTVLVPNFEFALDRGADGRMRLLPSKLIAGLDGAGRVLRTGLQIVSTSYDSLGSAPQGTYQRDSATVLTPGQTIAVEAETGSCLSNSRSTYLYAKLVMDSVGASGAAYFRAVVDPNCGYRSLRAGRPTS